MQKNTSTVISICRKHAEFIKGRRAAVGKRTGYYKIPNDEEFIPWLKTQQEFVESSDSLFKDIVRGPMSFVVQYNKYCVNGFLFVIKDTEDSKRNQNSGVSTNCTTTFRSSAKDKSPVDEYMMYYGVLRKIIQLEYREGYKPVLFKCDWVKPIHNGVKIDNEANLQLVNLSNLMSADKVGDEPFILAEHVVQVFYSKDLKYPEWHVVLEVPRKIYIEDELCILCEKPSITDAAIGPTNIEPIVVDELIFNDEDNVLVEKNTRRKRGKRSVVYYNYLLI